MIPIYARNYVNTGFALPYTLTPVTTQRLPKYCSMVLTISEERTDQKHLTCLPNHTLQHPGTIYCGAAAWTGKVECCPDHNIYSERELRSSLTRDFARFYA